MNVIKLCRKGNITNHEGDHSGFSIDSILYLPLFFFFLYLPLVMSDVDPSRLTLGSLFDTSSDLLSLAVSFNC